MRDPIAKKEQLFKLHLEQMAWGDVTVFRRASALFVPLLIMLIFVWLTPEESLNALIQQSWFWWVALVFVVALFIRIMMWANKLDNKDFKQMLVKVYAEYGLQPPVDNK